MRSKTAFTSIALSFTLGAWVGYGINALQTKSQESNKQTQLINQNTDSVTSKNLPELIADQIKSGYTSCPKSDVITYEACLLYQGALGTWQSIGMPDECPVVVGDDFQKFPRSPSEVIKLSPDHVLKAAKSACFGYLYSIRVANLTPVIVSTSNYSFQKATSHKFSKPGSDAVLNVMARYGICGNHAAVGKALFEKAGFVARTIEFYYADKDQRLSHIIVEAFIDGNWRPIDTTYGAYWSSLELDQPFRLITTDELISSNQNKLKPTWNQALLPHGFYSTISRQNYFNYLGSGADIVRGNAGVITIKIKHDTGKENFSHLPNFIGDNNADSQVDGIKFRLISDKGRNYRLTVNVSGSAFSSNDAASICIDISCEPYSKEKTKYEFIVQNPSQLFIKTDMDVAYVVMKSLDWEVVPN